MEIQNKNILKRILPYLFVFVFSFVIAGNEYVKQISAPTEAADESVNVSIANVAAPLDQAATWKWNAIIFVDSYFKQPIQAEYAAHWCSSTETGVSESEKTTCSPFSDPAEFRQTLKTEPIIITSRQTTTQLTHPGVSCGRVQVEVKRGEEMLAKKLFDTGVTCSEFGLAGLAEEEGDSDINSMRDMVLGFLGIFGKVNKVGNKPDTSGKDPENATPDPNNPGTPPPGGGTPGAPPPPVPIGNTGNPKIDKAIALYGYLAIACNGTLNIANLDYCLDPYTNQDVAKFLKADIKAMIATYPSLAPLQCVVAARSFMYAANGRSFPSIGDQTPRTLANKTNKNFGNLEWHSNDGTDRIQPNDLAIWDYMPHGHMAYVIDVKGDSFSVIESNTILAGYISASNHTLDGGVVGWYRMK